MNIRSLITATLVALLIVGCAGSRTQESTGEYIDDAAITTKVKTQLLRSKETSGTAISVETFKGVVQLSGFVESDVERRRAEEIAEGVKGVQRVENRISVRGS
jgi:osmotically-inducible protein OsmY